jgi:YaiO family outer membrane protein
LSGTVLGQRSGDTTVVITDTTNIDALFKRAREFGNNDNYNQARRICMKILEKKPNYHEVRTYLGRTYAWEKQYDNARTELSRVLIEKENDYEALSALFDVEFWTESYSVANDYLKVALGYYPTSEELLIKKAKLQIKLEEKNEAALTLRRVLDLNPGHKEAIRLMNTLEGRKLNNNFQMSLLADLWDSDDPHQIASAEIGRHFFFGSLTLRNLYVDRFNKAGFQHEIESYAHFTRTTYVNLLFGYSTLSYLPKQRYTVEIYQKLPAGFELSFGVRYLQFTDATKIYSTSVSNYYKDYWFSLRAFIVPKSDQTSEDIKLNTTSITVIASIRTYFGDSENYLGIKIGSGRSPDETRPLDEAPLLPKYQTGIELQKRAFGRWLMKCDITYAKENRTETTFKRRISTQVTLKTVF